MNQDEVLKLIGGQQITIWQQQQIIAKLEATIRDLHKQINQPKQIAS